MTGFETLLDRLLAGRDLPPEEAGDAVRSIMAGEWSDAQTAAFLVALSGKGETAAEISAGARVMPRLRGEGQDRLRRSGGHLRHRRRRQGHVQRLHRQRGRCGVHGRARCKARQPLGFE